MKPELDAQSWMELADKRRIRYVASGASALPSLEGRVDGADVVVSVVVGFDGDRRFRTRATTTANIPLRGTVRVRPAGTWEGIFRGLTSSSFFDERELDRLLVVKTSSDVLARTVLDARVLTTVRALARRRLELSYEAGAIAIEWDGFEPSLAVLDDVLDVLAYLAVRGAEETPYR
jgi:hypothetical protein